MAAKVMVTGAGGSIKLKELCLQIAAQAAPPR